MILLEGAKQGLLHRPLGKVIMICDTRRENVNIIKGFVSLTTEWTINSLVIWHKKLRQNITSVVYKLDYSQS